MLRNPEMARAWQDGGYDVAIADARDAASLTKAFSKCKGVFVMTPPNYDAIATLNMPCGSM